MRLNLITLAVTCIAMVFFLGHASQLPWTGMHIVGLVMTIPSFVLVVLARIQLGDAFSMEACATTLVTTGLYSRIRNPIYTFSALLLVGILLLANRPLWLLCLLVLVPIQIFRSRREAHVLEERFGSAYLQYRRKTWF
jgi:protein-S-isoprenylcysteine O-methyltransferase Ste14